MHRIGPQTASAPMAFLSDIHGNLAALQAVLAELGRRAVVEIYVAGDHLLGGEQPLEVWTTLQRAKAHCTRGPSDVALATVDPARLQPEDAGDAARAARFVDTRRALGELVLRRLGELPASLRVPMVDGGELMMVHGSPADPLEPIGHELEDDEVYALLAGDPADVVICGATHVPFDRTVGDVRVLNVGSVGDAPEGRVAHFTVLHPRVDGPLIEQSWVEY